jgi:hypothetical protein
MVTAVPTAPLGGANDTMVGGEPGVVGAYLMVA